MTVHPWPEPAEEPEGDPDALTDEEIDALSAEELTRLVADLEDQARPPWGLFALAAGILLWVLTRIQIEVDTAAITSVDPRTGEVGVPGYGAAWLVAKLALVAVAAALGVLAIARSRRWRVAAGAGLGAAAWWLGGWVLDGLQHGFVV